MHNRSICFPHFNSDQRSEAANRHVTDLSLMHLRDTWLSYNSSNRSNLQTDKQVVARKCICSYVTIRRAIWTHGRDFFTGVDAVFGSGRTEPNVGSMADAFDLEFRRTAAISGRN